MTNPDRLVAKRLLAGDEAAFAEVFDDFFPRLYRYALARVNGNEDEARDVVQHTFCKAFERLGSYRGEASLYGWMHQICRNALIDRARRRARRGEMPAITGADDAIRALVDALAAPRADEPEHALARLNLLQLIQAALDCLPAHYGNALEWKYLEGLSVTDIAARLAIGPKAAESLLSRARSAFKEAILELSESADLFPGDAGPAARG